MTSYRGIVLAGGRGTRLFPTTVSLSKQLLPVYDKPLVYYPLGNLLLAGIRDILVISSPEHVACFRKLLGDGRQLGVRFHFAVQDEPRGIADALLVGESFLAGHCAALALGDNILYGEGFHSRLRSITDRAEGAAIFAYPVRDPRPYGVVDLDEAGNVLGLEEKPDRPTSQYAIPGLYFYDPQAPAIARTLTRSARGELEITDLNRRYLEQGQLRAEVLGRGYAWMDAGSPDALLQAANYVQAIEKRQGLKIACLEEIAYRKGFIDREQLLRLANESKGDYADYLRQLA